MQKPLDDITAVIIAEAIKLHRHLGPGLLEAVYEQILAQKLERCGLQVQRQIQVPFDYEGLHFDRGLRIDLLVENRVVVELKAQDVLPPTSTRQVLTYLRLLGLEVGLLINFGAPTLKEGLRRVVNNYRRPEQDS